MAEQVSRQLDKLPPQATDMERAVLGAMLIDPDSIGLTIELLKETDFYKPGHAAIYRALTDLFDANLPVDQLTVSEQLKKKKQLELIGGEPTISALINDTASSANIRYHSHVIREKALLRRLISDTTASRNMCFEDTVDPGEVIKGLEQSLMNISELQHSQSYTPISKVVIQAQAEIQRKAEAGEGLTGIDTGFKNLNKLTTGWQNSDLIILAGRPSMGKTAFGLDLAKNAAHTGVPVAVFSLEMSTMQLVMRLLYNEGRFNGGELHTNKPKPADWTRLNDAAGRLHDLPMFIDDTPGLSIMELGAKAKRLKLEHDIGLLVVDYLQLMQGSSRESRQQEISSISRGLKILAKELNIPIIALSQLSRGLEQRTGDKKPMLSDLRESGAIEQDADIVMFIYRASVYGLEPEYQIYDQDIPTDEVAEIIVRKQRNGPVGSVLLHWIKHYMRFGEFAYETGGELF